MPNTLENTTNARKLVTLVDLRKNQVPLIAIYGDDPDHKFTKLIWTLIPGHDVRLTNPDSHEELMRDAYNSALVFVMVHNPDDENLKMAEELSRAKGVVADIVAITPEQDIRARLHMLSAKFDAIYNLDIVSTADFKNIFLHKLKKGIKRLQARLQEDEYETFLGFLSASADSFVVFDRSRRVFYVSDQFLRLYPKSESTFERGTPVKRVFDAIVAEMDVSPDSPQYGDVQDFWTELSGQKEIMLDNGTHLRMTAVPLPNGQGTIVSTTNVTTYKRQEQALADKQAELSRALSAEQEASSLQKQFISMVSHEFRTPLSIVDGNAQILERRFDDLPREEVKNRLRTIRSAVSRTINMMQAVLSSNLLKTGKMDLDIEEFSLKELIHDMCREQSDLARDINIHVDTDRLPDVVRMDSRIIILILTNLLANAVKFSPENPVIHVTSYHEGGRIVIKVKDNGVGIPQEEQTKIFERFYRASTARNISGSGVGLSLVHDLTHVHDGMISLKSAVGKGTEFILSFPYTP